MVMHPRSPDTGLQTATDVFGRLPDGWIIARAVGTWEFYTGIGPPIGLELEFLHTGTGVQLTMTFTGKPTPERVAWVLGFLVMVETMPTTIEVSSISHRWKEIT